MEAGKHETSFVLVGKITSAFSPALFVDRAISVKTKTGKPSAPREHAAPSRPARRGSCPAAPVGGGGTSDPSLPSYKKHMQQGASSAVRWREGGTHLLLAYADRCCTLGLAAVFEAENGVCYSEPRRLQLLKALSACCSS